MLSGAFSDVPLAVMSNGVPLVKLRMLLTCQPPTIAASTPPPFSQRRFGPNGSSVRFVICRLCVRSKGLIARVEMVELGNHDARAPSLRGAPAIPVDFDKV